MARIVARISYPTLVRLANPALIGVATGIRSSAGLAAVTVTSAHPWAGARVASTLALAGELVVDKLPGTPSRLEPAGLVARLAMGAVTATVLARRAGSATSGVVMSAAAGLIGAGVASVVGARWRRAAARVFGADLPGALIEDAVGLGFAARAVGRY